MLYAPEQESPRLNLFHGLHIVILAPEEGAHDCYKPPLKNFFTFKLTNTIQINFIYTCIIKMYASLLEYSGKYMKPFSVI